MIMKDWMSSGNYQARRERTKQTAIIRKRNKEIINGERTGIGSFPIIVIILVPRTTPNVSIKRFSADSIIYRSEAMKQLK
jgi:hypothetical protein